VKKPDGYNGPGKDEFFESLARYEEHRFHVMRYTSLAGAELKSWEKRGGNKKEIQQGYNLRQMSKEEQQADILSQIRVAGWMGAIDEDRTGQASFLRAFDTKPVPTGIGGAPLGTPLSIIRAKVAGYNDAKTKDGPSMGEGQELYEWEMDSEEALAYAEGFGEGLPLRPLPKKKKGDVEDESGGQESSGGGEDTGDDDGGGDDGDGDGGDGETSEEESENPAPPARRGGRKKAAAPIADPDKEWDDAAPSTGFIPRVIN
jgi:hypothetical protein